MAITISTIVPAYNCEATLARALDSIVAQTHPPDEIIVVNDGSVDSTAAVIESYAKKHSIIKYVTQENSGPAIARNKGVKLATSEWVSFLDADDYWYSHHLKNLVAVITAHPDLAWASAAYEIEKFVGPARGFSQAILPNYLAVAHCRSKPVHTDTVLIRRKIFWECGGFRKDWRNEEDLWLWFQIGLRYPQLGHSPTISSFYSNQPNSLTKQFSSYQEELDLMVHHTDKMIQYINDHNLLERKDVQLFLGGRIGKILYTSLLVSHHEYKKNQQKYSPFLAYVILSRRARVYAWLSLLRMPVSLLHVTAVGVCRCLYKLLPPKSHLDDAEVNFAGK